jgi:hypothetical protein
MSNKTISINPSLFTLGGKKTKKNREKVPAAKIKPLISPNVLKNKLLKRIKEHKQFETQNLDSKTPSEQINEKDKKEYNDEFNDSLSYLQTLSKQKKVNDEKANYEKKMQKQKELLERKTIKNHTSLQQQPFVNIDLPEELQINIPVVDKTAPSIRINNAGINNDGTNNLRDNVPYGVLKGGAKPTYREWNKTQRSNIVTSSNSALIIDNNQLNKGDGERERRLKYLREKLKVKQMEENKMKTENALMNQPLIKPNVVNDIGTDNDNGTNFNGGTNVSSTNVSSTNVISTNVISTNVSGSEIAPIIINPLTNVSGATNNNNEEIIAIKQIHKKTIKKTYTLGKSKIKNKVGILIKDRGTRKQILNAQKDLKKKSINEIKSYLREHNLIKVGSNAPNDIIRKLYESSMLAGEITNSNSETLLHNLSQEEKEL